MVHEVICRHGVPEVLISDRGANLLSTLMQEICTLAGIQKVNTTAYHPQTDGLVENFNKTLRAMIVKYCHTYGTNWDEYLPRLLFAYRSKCHSSTLESPFFLLYGPDPRLPTEEALSFIKNPYLADVDDYKTELMSSLSEAWRVVRDNITKAQRTQKLQYDKKCTHLELAIGDRVMVFMPQEVSGKQRKLARPYYGPYRVIDIHPNGVTVRPVDKPNDGPVRVNMDRVTCCPLELPDTSWLGSRKTRRGQKKS